ncbi:lytic transglycosylase domain-containing protein [Pararobbsia silviterrae]|nr:lytic transglycosylase domain-containing protein [Pararobbsia silviterrae]
MNKLAKSVADANKVEYKAPGLEAVSKDLAKIQKQFQDAIRQSTGLRNALKNSGQNADAGILNIDWNRLNIDPKIAASLKARTIAFATQGTSLDTKNTFGQATPNPAPAPRDRQSQSSTRGPGVGTQAAQSFASGVGGAAGQIGNSAIKGAASGAKAGVDPDEGGINILGGVGGLLKGAGIGAVIAGGLAAGKAVSNGIDMAKDRAMTLDTLKRQMGDLGFSFDELKESAKGVSVSLGVNSAEFARLEQQNLQASHGIVGNELHDSTEFGVGAARAYGMDPSAYLAFQGQMRAIDPATDHRQLATYIAEAINGAGSKALPQEVIQAIQSLSSSTSRLALYAPNVGAEGSAFTSMLRDNKVGMTPDVAQAILGQANSSMMNMGSAGEAGKNFIMQALNDQGGTTMNPLEARELASGGLFATPRTRFAPNSTYAKFVNDDARMSALANGPNADRTNMEAIRAYADKVSGGNKELELDLAQNLYGLSTQDQAAALLGANPTSYGKLGKLLEKSGVSLNDVNGSGLATLGRLSGASDMWDLNGIYQDLQQRTGNSALSDSAKSDLEKAHATGDFDTFQQAIAKAVASMGQTETTATQMRKLGTGVDDLEIGVGDKALTVLTTIEGGIDKLVNYFTSGAGGLADQVSNSLDIGVHPSGPGGTTPAQWNNYGSYTLAQKQRVISSMEEQYNLPAGLLKGVWGTESSYGRDATKASSAGALGNFQEMPGTIKRYGVKIGDFASEADGSARQLSDLIALHNGDVKEALLDYGGFNPKDPNRAVRGAGYIAKVEEAGGVNELGPQIIPEADNKLPTSDPSSSSKAAKAAPSSGSTDTVVVDMNFNVLDASTGQKKTLNTSVNVPRGSGTQYVSVTGQ